MSTCTVQAELNLRQLTTAVWLTRILSVSKLWMLVHHLDTVNAQKIVHCCYNPSTLHHSPLGVFSHIGFRAELASSKLDNSKSTSRQCSPPSSVDAIIS